MTKIKKIGIMSAAKIEGLMGLIMGLIVALIFAIIGGLVSSLSGIEGSEALGLFGGGIFMIIAVPIFYGVIGFIAGAIGAAIYNLIAGWIGGIEIELEEKK